VNSLRVKVLMTMLAKSDYGIAQTTNLPYHLRRLRIVDGFQVHLHGRIVVLLSVQVITIFAEDDVLLGGIESRPLG
jgi:hypothetical protein